MDKLIVLTLGIVLLSTTANAREVRCHATVHRSFKMMSIDDLFRHQQELSQCEKYYADVIRQFSQDVYISQWKDKKLQINVSLDKLEAEVRHRLDEAIRVTDQYDIETLEELMVSYKAILGMDVSDSIKGLVYEKLQEVEQRLARYESQRNAALDGYDIVEGMDDEYLDVEMDLPDYTHRMRQRKLFSRMKRNILHLNQSHDALTMQQVTGLLGSAGTQPVKRASKRPMIKVTGNR
ncbi:hypothetical protein CI610_02541 [invertebrate metagenome]|uniref:Uncharacterized protein n=1 Tax=invertebrate metagenome TaxID=1711999 RepID=A0A2H9T5M0_9ZZZZ